MCILQNYVKTIKCVICLNMVIRTKGIDYVFLFDLPNQVIFMTTFQSANSESDMEIFSFNLTHYFFKFIEYILQVTADINSLAFILGNLSILINCSGVCAKVIFGPLPFTVIFIIVEAYKICMMALIGVFNISAFIQFSIILDHK